MTPDVLFLVDATAAAPIEVSPHDPALTVTQLAATRGDGIFETIVVVHGVPQAMRAHLDRFARSARMLDLPAPDLDAWEAVIQAAADRMRAHPRAAIKYVLSRGDEAGENATMGWVLGFVSPPRQAGPIRVVTLDRGYRSDVAQTSPWLLQGAKTLSYALNMAALREARRRGADDVVFVSTDGLVLEGPNSTVIARVGDTFVTPPVDLGILPGTTQHDAFVVLAAAGHATAVRTVTVDELRDADALWLCSSTRGAAAVSHLDGVERSTDDDITALIATGLDARKA
ncbi:aminodeoxychorismate lyase [Microbacterium dextranolyticum]|uniref:4-amino-4-deoxychorismate lyase n=1 Tax=Microbacterium dextranolyticum TaxID=36806 RepID=A0A9W6HL42_9MICO|nr:aminodeoxychorismate lyase [Microbacterium dextranolyticum]MBM7464261.1 4-amino-4-deoxychorismate lyase [Microbacterium dextranolyticum]GLJ95255.1 4-amino-4-deoxychorismate lyase [Microbacterium dextranolyticum]